MEIENNLETFVLLWRMMERTRRLLAGHYKRFCIRNSCKSRASIPHSTPLNVNKKKRVARGSVDFVDTAGARQSSS